MLVIFWLAALLPVLMLLVSLATRPQKVVKYEPLKGPLVNPLMGWAPWATADDIHQPHTLVYADLTWREFEPQEGRFDFSAFEEENHLQMWREQGVRVIFRFVMDVPRDEGHLDIPDWLYAATGANGIHYDVEYGKGYSPDYSDLVLIEAHRKAVQALGARYGQDDFFAYVQLGSLGHWGEWHVKSDSNIIPLPDRDIRDQYVAHYLEAFPKTHLLMRRPFSIAREEGLGLYNDMTGDPDATQRWLSWIVEGGEYSQTGEPDALAAMPEGWQLAPVGGEQTGSLSDQALYGESLGRTLDLLKASHATFIGPGGPYDSPQNSALQNGLDEVLAGIGYRFFVSELEIPVRVIAGNRLTGSAVLSNVGNAPFYYPWPVWFYVLDEDGNVQVSWSRGENLLGLLPEESRVYDFSIPLENLKIGIYSLGIGVVDPLLGDPAVQFAMANSREGAIQVLETFEVGSWQDSVGGWFRHP